MNQWTQQGIAALKLGDRTAARQLLAAAIKQDPRDITAWLWLAGALDKEEEQIDCLRYVLKIDPHNQAAALGLAQLLKGRSTPQTPPPAAPQAAPEPAPPVQPAQPGPEPSLPPAEPLAEQPAGAPAEISPLSGQSAIDAMRESVQVLDEPEPPAPDTEPAVPVDAPASMPQPVYRRAASPAVDENAQVIFRTRPSLVPALICFWLFLFGAVALASMLRELPSIGLLLAGVMGFALQFIVIYAVIRGLAERYELTSQQLTLRFRGKRARIPIQDIYHAELNQSFFQRLLGTGNVEIDAAVGGQLAHLSMRNIPQSSQRVDQIMYLVKDHAST